MSRADSRKMSIAELAFRLSMFVVMPFYLFFVWVFYARLLGSYGFFGKLFGLAYWWFMGNLGVFLLAVIPGIILMRIFCDWRFGANPLYRMWLNNGGSPFWDFLPSPINIDPPKIRMSISAPPDYDVCPNDGGPLGRRFGNQCMNCGILHDGCFFES